MIRSTHKRKRLLTLTVKSITIDKLLHYYSQVFGLSILDAPVNHVRRALLHAELVYLSEKLRNHLLTYVFVPEFECLLNGIVSIRVLCQFNSVDNELFHHFESVFVFVGLLHNDFDNAQSAVVGG